MRQAFVIFAGMAGAAGVGLGAATAHLDLDADSQRVIDTGLRYLWPHLLALLFCLDTRLVSKPFALAAGGLFSAGLLLFCGSLFVIGVSKGALDLAILTPFGGVAFILAWLSLVGGGLAAARER